MRRMLLVILMLAAARTLDAAAVPPAWAHLRCLTDLSRELASAAAERSTLISSFIDELERSDVVVYLKVVASPSEDEFRASTTFLSWSAGTRFLFVRVDAFHTLPIEQIALLGHELRHCLEVALAPQVRDLESFRNLFAKTGNEWQPGQFETDAARVAERRVREEVLWRGSTHGRAKAYGARPR